MKTEKAKVIWEYYDNGQLKSEQYRINGKLHNPNGPACKFWYDNGQLESEEYCINGKYHNPNGPARKFWYKNSKLISEEYWVNGRNLTKENFHDLRTLFHFSNSNNTCNGKIVEIEGKKYKLEEIG